MNLYIRCDGSPVIGLGHVIRMMALARQIVTTDSGSHIYFMMRDLSESVKQMVKKEGFEVLTIPGSEDTYTVNPDAELDVICRLADSNKSVMIIDHYGYGLSLVYSVRALFKTLVLIDDYQPDRCIKEIDMLVNPNFSAETVGYPKYKDQLQLLGPQYSILREQFASSSHPPYFVRNQCENILICFGGSDTMNITASILKLFNQLEGNLTLTVITGSENHDIEMIRRGAEQSRHLVIVKTHVNNMAEKFLRQDLLVLPSSTMALEAMALGVPCAVLSCEDNQLPGGLAMKELETTVYLGDYKYVNWDVIRRTLQMVIRDAELRGKLSVRAKERVNGDGAQIVAEAILKLCSRPT
ncbi:UDP-2,4-diacetamido-2,4,6-trideoxy-beta-L-altropyranose hydrolase [Paenibacillus sp. FSL H8-0034]|uniref:UDP-2,4-diacetamido-2,4, 6-trideoxy-beta-L-altropyranose hydrolase n=1 Tax=Paenibacillus sp. FSL H8-0034 TaxID=2954671 RepID=UPI0030F94626